MTTRGRPCLIDGCPRTHPSFRMCTPHWNKLPAKLKQRWWDETYYGTGAPGEELIADVNAASKEE